LEGEIKGIEEELPRLLADKEELEAKARERDTCHERWMKLGIIIGDKNDVEK